METINMNEEEAIEQIIDNFNFDFVHSFMTINRWTYSSNNIPSIDTLKEKARDLMIRACKDGNTTISSGGLVASCRPSKIEGKNKYISLHFSIEQQYESF